MTRKISIQIKAAFLLIVFSLNTVIGFASAWCVNMCYNHSHHQKEQKLEISLFDSGIKQHQHSEENHSQAKKEHSEKCPCCKHEKAKFQNLDKNISQEETFSCTIFLSKELSHISKINNQSKIASNKWLNYIDTFFHPPPDICILIQRFQI